MAIPPLNGARLSCMLFTEPVVKAVVISVNKVIIWAESKGNPILQHLGLSQAMGNMEGKETRFGTNMSALFTEITTAFTTGSVNNMHDSLAP